MNRQEALNAVLREMYGVISFADGEEPDWRGLRAVFLPQARITRITHEGRDEYELDSFCAMLREMILLGAITAFHEIETSRRADIVGGIAHVLSAYETKVSPSARDWLSRGLNSVQLVWEEDQWRVLSLLWDERIEGRSEVFETFTADETLYDRCA